MRTRTVCATVIWTSNLCGAALSRALAQGVSQEQFDALKEQVRQQGEQMQKLLETVRELQDTNAAAAQMHQKDVQQIQELQQRLAQQPAISNMPPRTVEAA